MGAIPNGNIFLSTTRRYTAISNGFHECWLQAWEPLWKSASPCRIFCIFRLNPETDTPPKTFRFHTRSHSKSEDFPFF